MVEIKRIKKCNNNYAHVIGIGNLVRLDDGIGAAVINELRKKDLPSSIKITDLSTGGIDLIQLLEGFSLAIIIDAVDIKGLKPGEIITLSVTEANLPEVKGFSSTHGFDIFTALKIAYQLENYNLPEQILIIGIQIKNIHGLGTNLSKEVKEAIPLVIEKILKTLV